MPMQSYQRYPLIMHHPAASPAVVSDDRNASGFRPAQSARFQPVTVHNADQEAQHRAQGYKPLNEPNEKEFVRVQAAPTPFGHAAEEWPKMVDGHVVEDPSKPHHAGPIEYPKWVQHPAGHKVIVQNRDEEVDLLGLSKPEATDAEGEDLKALSAPVAAEDEEARLLADLEAEIAALDEGEEGASADAEE